MLAFWVFLFQYQKTNCGRRSKLPVPKPDSGDISLWNILYKNIGKDLTKISMPVTLNEPLSMLQVSGSIWKGGVQLVSVIESCMLFILQCNNQRKKWHLNRIKQFLWFYNVIYFLWIMILNSRYLQLHVHLEFTHYKCTGSCIAALAHLLLVIIESCKIKFDKEI